MKSPRFSGAVILKRLAAFDFIGRLGQAQRRVGLPAAPAWWRALRGAFTRQALSSLFSSLRFRLILLVLLALLPALGVILYTANEQRQLAAVAAQEQALQVARTVSSVVNDLADSTHQLLGLLAQEEAVRNVDPKVCPSFLAQLMHQTPRYTNLGVVARGGNNVCRAVPAQNPSGGPPNFYQRVMDTRDFAASDFTIGQASGKAAVIFGYPIFDQAGQVEAVVYAGLDLTFLSQVISHSELPKGSTLMVNDSRGTVLARYPDPLAWVGRAEPDAPKIREMLAQQEEGTFQAIGGDNVPRLYAFTTLDSIPNGTAYLSVGIPVSEAFAEVDGMLTRNLLALGAVAVLALGAAWFGGDLFILRQMRALLGATRRVADGDLSARAGLESGSGEFAQLSQSFDQMAAALEQRDAARHKAEDQVRRWSAEVQSLMSALAEAISLSSQAKEISEIALTRTLSALDLAAGAVLLKSGDAFALVTHRGLSEGAVHELEQSAREPVGANPIARRAHADLILCGSLREPTPGPLPPSDPAEEWVSIPILSRGQALGVICLSNPGHRLLEPHERRVLAAVGQQVGVAIENMELREQVQSMAALRERERLSRELHDGLAQVLGYLVVRAEIAKELVARGQAEQATAQLQETQVVVREAQRELREEMLGLRVALPSPGGLRPALEEYAHRFSRQSGIQVSLVPDGGEPARFSPEVEVQLLRIVQEALSNVRKHSKAKHAWIRFEAAPEGTVVTIQDDGIGFDGDRTGLTGQPHFGLDTMRERAEAVGGSLRVRSEPGRGAQVVVTLPARRGG